MKIKFKDYRVRESEKVNLKKWPTKVKPVYQSKNITKTPEEQAITELAATPVYASDIRAAADIPGDGRRRQGRRHRT
jgi:hypothetical protein